MGARKKEVKAPRQPAAVEHIDLDSAKSEEELKPAMRRSVWVVLLEELYTATEEGNVPRDEDGRYKFVKLAEYKNVNGARTQARILEDRGEGGTFEFKTITRGGRSELWGRVH